MSCYLLIKNKPNSYRKGEVITVLDGDVELTDGIDKALFELKNGAGSWDRRTVLVHVTDRDKHDLEIKSLLENDDSGQFRRKRFIVEQDQNSPFYEDLLNKARVDVSYSTLQGLII